MLHAGLDLSRSRLDVCLLDEGGQLVRRGVASPDRGGLARLARDVEPLGGPVLAAIESMNGARFVHDTLELAGWDVEIADAQKVNGLAPLACKTDRIDAWVLAELSRRDLVPAIWLPDPAVRAERERARFRLHLVRHRGDVQEPHPRHADRVRKALSGLGPLPHRWTRTPRAPGDPRAVASEPRHRAGDPRRTRRAHRRLRGRAANPGR
jgi:hypothetical protein